MEVVLRESCNACYKLKTKCISAGGGACENCRRRGRPCQFSPRNEMGRPRRHARKCSGAKMRQPIQTPSTAPDPELLEIADQPGPPLQVSSEYTARQDVVDLPWKSPNPPESTSSIVTQSLLPWGDEIDQYLMTEAPDPSGPSWAYPTPPPSCLAMQLASQPSPALDSCTFAEDFDLSEFQSLLADPFVSTGLPKNNNVDSWELVGQSQPAESLDFALSVSGVSVAESTGVVDTYSQLAQMLFALRTTQGKKDQGESITLRNRTFAIVSSLCDMIEMAQLCSPENREREALLPCLMLVVSIISVVVEVYSRYISEFAPSWRYETGTLNTHRCLQRHADATVMDLHLRQLRQVLRGTGLAMHDVRTIQMIDQMRATLEAFFENWKNMMDNSEWA